MKPFLGNSPYKRHLNLFESVHHHKLLGSMELGSESVERLKIKKKCIRIRSIVIAVVECCSVIRNVSFLLLLLEFYWYVNSLTNGLKTIALASDSAISSLFGCSTFVPNLTF